MARPLDKKLPLVDGCDDALVGLSTFLMALLKASIVLALSVIFFRISGLNNLVPVSPRSSLQISFIKELSFGRDLEMLLIIDVCLLWDMELEALPIRANVSHVSLINSPTGISSSGFPVNCCSARCDQKLASGAK